MSRRTRRRTAGALALALALGGGLAACGVYGPPRRASEVEASRSAETGAGERAEEPREDELPEDTVDGR